jgi:hypothetical protein
MQIGQHTFLRNEGLLYQDLKSNSILHLKISDFIHHISDLIVLHVKIIFRCGIEHFTYELEIIKITYNVRNSLNIKIEKLENTKSFAFASVF